MDVKNVNLYQQKPVFTGLWGYATYNKQPLNIDFASHGYTNFLPRTLELFQIDKFYPFADDSSELINKEVSEGLKNGVRNSGGQIVPFSQKGALKIQKPLPFTRAEYLAYKAKNMQSKAIELSAAEKTIEYFLEPIFKGLRSYKNQYKELTPTEAFVLKLSKLAKRIK